MAQILSVPFRRLSTTLNASGQDVVADPPAPLARQRPLPQMRSRSV